MVVEFVVNAVVAVLKKFDELGHLFPVKKLLVPLAYIDGLDT